jgi:polyphosphate kinase
LEEAEDKKNPLLERLKFLAIFVSNLDEFLMVRVAALKNLIEGGYNQKDKFGYYPSEIYAQLIKRVRKLIERVYSQEWKKLSKELNKHSVFIKKFGDLNNDEFRFAMNYLENTLFPIMTPFAVDQGRPLPLLPSRTLAFAVLLKKDDRTNFAVMSIPQNIPRLFTLPSESDEHNFILIDEIIRYNLDQFFRGYEVQDKFLFRGIRDSELSVVEGYEESLLQSMENELKKRPRAKVVHLEIESCCPTELLKKLCEIIDFPEDGVTNIEGDPDLTYLFQLISGVNRPKLKYKSFIPAEMEYTDIFDKIQEGPFLVHLPYQSFSPTVEFINSSAKDKNVLAIKMTLYRTNEDSHIITALEEAAKNGKQVTVLVEIQARFDEERNIKWVRELENAGCHVLYGIAGMKIHSKIAMVVRREEKNIRRYVHLSTGNYNEKTAAIYTDIGYFTANEDIARDVSDVFNVITGYSMPTRRRRVVSAPHNLRQYFFELIDREIEFQKNYKNGLIFAKMNSLEDTKTIDKLYEAAEAGVKVRLIVRGICSLVPGVQGMSETIRVKSIVGRYLEHSRIFMFNNNANYRLFLSSADWMSRNLDRRVELLFEIYNEKLKEHLKFILDTYWKDDIKSRYLQPDRKYSRSEKKKQEFNAQDFFIQNY